jgi:peroxiredoxin
MHDKPIAHEFDKAFQRARDLDGPLAARLDLYASECRRLAPACASAWDRLIDRLVKCGTGRNAPGLGEMLPPLLLSDECGLLVSADDLLADGPLAMVFHVGHWCPFSRLNGIALSGAHEAATATGGRIIAITPDSQQYAARLRRDSGGRVRVLTDRNNAGALTLGIAVWIGIELQQQLAERGTVLPSFQHSTAWMIPLPATFVVSGKGRIFGRCVPADLRKRMAIDEMLGALGAASRAA